MKCQHCGANLTIDDEVCSFCGSANPFAAKHRREMRRFTNEFNRTKTDVLKESRHHSKWAAKITLIAVMVALNLIIWFAIGNSYEIEDFFMRQKVEGEYFKHKAALDEYEENRQFIAFEYYYNENDLYCSDMFDEYRVVSNVCSQYMSAYTYLMNIVTKDETDYYSHEDYLEYLSEQLEYLYDFASKDEYDDPNWYKPIHQECMYAAVKQMEDLIQTYLGVSDEDIANFSEMSTARRQIIMEEGLKYYE